MSGRIGDEPDMDVYAGVIAAHAAHPASAREFRETQDRRIDARAGRTDIFTGEFIPFTDEEIAQAKYDRRVTIGSIGFFVLVMVTGVAAFWLGWMTGTGQLS